MKSNEQHVDASQSNSEIISTKIFESFRILSNGEKLEKINGAINLIQHLNSKHFDGDHDAEPDKETKYTLQRLVRGTGAATADSRTSYFTTLVAFLSLPPSQDRFPSVSDIFNVVDKELRVGKSGCKDKADSDAIVGQTLVCGAILHSNKIQEVTAEEIKKIVQILLNASHQKPFHSSLAYAFLNELLGKLSSTEFHKTVWPIVGKELKRPWEKHTLNTVQLLLEIRTKYPQLVDEEFLLSSITTNEILQPLAFKHLGRLFWSPPSITIAISHPAYETIGKFLATSVASKQLLKFWQNEINEILVAPSKSKEIVTLKILTIIFNSKTVSHETATHLLSDSFIKLIIKTLKNSKHQKMEIIIPFYDEFFEAIESYLDSLTQTPSADTAKVAIIKRFLVSPGSLLIEKYTSNRIIHKFIARLGVDGIAQLYDFYKSILLGQYPKNPKDKTEDWLFLEKQHSIQMMQALLAQKCCHNQLEWRTEQLKQLLKLSLFYTGSGSEVVVTRENDAGTLSKDLQIQLKQVFYANLQIKLHHLESELKILLPLVELCNEFLAKKSANKFLRQPLSDKALQSWQKMYARVTSIKKSKKNQSNLNTVFNVLLLHMGLQLFRETEMAELAIDDLEKCMEKADKKFARSAKNENEPEWIEVVVDLFLHLLSQNTNFLRNIVNSVFPQLCDSLNLQAVHQILSVLDMKEKNPLSVNGSNVSDDEDEDENEDENDEDSDNDTDEEKEEESEGEDQDSNDEDNENEMDLSMDEDEGTVTDHLRSVVSSALGATGPETDTESVDLNDMDDAEAERLDKALSEAFQSIRKKPSGNSKKKTKKERTTNTTVMHFRIRVLDLLEIYLDNNPNLMITLEILIALLGMLDHCKVDKDLKPLSNTVDRVLKKLFAIRQFSIVDDITEDHLVDILSKLVERKVTPNVLEEHNKLVSKSCTFLINVSDLLTTGEGKHKFYQLIEEYLEKFLKTRNPMFAFSCFRDIMKIRWHGVWKLGVILVEKGLLAKNEARGFRRSQAIELLDVIYKNHGFIAQDIDQFNKINKKIEKHLEEYVKWLQTKLQISPKEYHALLELLRDIHKCSTTIKGYKSSINWKIICDGVQEIRKHTTLLKYQMYAAFCNHFKIPIIKNVENGVQKLTKGQNHNSQQNGACDTSTAQTKQSNGNLKRKAEADDEKRTQKKLAKKAKRLIKEERLKIASAGFDDTITFSQTNGVDNGHLEGDSDV